MAFSIVSAFLPGSFGAMQKPGLAFRQGGEAKFALVRLTVSPMQNGKGPGQMAGPFAMPF